MTHIYSEAVFQSKLHEYGLDGLWSRFQGKGWSTIGAFAVSCGYNPQNVTDAILLEKMVKHICNWNGAGEEPTLANNTRRLFWECLQSVVAEKHDEWRKGLSSSMREPQTPLCILAADEQGWILLSD